MDLGIDYPSISQIIKLCFKSVNGSLQNGSEK
jgi:hypothetical protein